MTLLGIATVVLLITVGKVHPFRSLIFGAAVLGVVAGLGPSATIDSAAGSRCSASSADPVLLLPEPGGRG